MSVSLDPALVLISLKNDSHMRNVIDAEGRFGVSILADGQQSVSDHFAGRFVDECGGASLTILATRPLLPVRLRGSHALSSSGISQATTPFSSPMWTISYSLQARRCCFLAANTGP